MVLSHRTVRQDECLNVLHRDFRKSRPQEIPPSCPCCDMKTPSRFIPDLDNKLSGVTY